MNHRTEIMGQFSGEMVIFDSMDNRVVSFSDNIAWQLTKKLSEKSWEGSTTQERANWQPSEAHVVYECVQTRDPQLRKEAIVKVRIEYTNRKASLPVRCNPTN